MKFILIGIVIWLFAIDVYAVETQAPFGLSWGQSKSELEGKGIVFSECEDDGMFDVCLTAKPVKPVSFGKIYLLLFDSENGLQQVGLFGKEITGDITGKEGKEVYSKIKSSLSKKYGQPESHEYFGLHLYSEYDEFYQCLRYDGCGEWKSFWKPDGGGKVVLGLRGISRGRGKLAMGYESKNFSGLADAHKKQKQAKDDDAL